MQSVQRGVHQGWEMAVERRRNCAADTAAQPHPHRLADGDLQKARSRLDRQLRQQPNTHFFRFFEIYKTIWLNFQKVCKILQKISDFRKNQHFFCKIPETSQKFCKILRFVAKFATFLKNQLASFVDREKPEKMRIWLQNFVSIQPRTSLEKSDVS